METFIARVEKNILGIANGGDGHGDSATSGPEPAAKVSRRVDGLREQVTDPHLFSLCHSTVTQLSAGAHRRSADDEMMQPPQADVEHLVRFCLSGIGVRVGEATHT